MLTVLAIDAPHGGLDVFVERRHCPIQHVGHEEQHVLEFVGDGHVLGGVLVGLPAGRDQQADVLQCRVEFLRRHRRVDHVHEVADDLLFLAQDRSPRRLRRMRREHRFDAQRVDQFLQLASGHAVGLEPDERVFGPTGLVALDVAQVLPPPPDAVHFLCGVHHLEVGGEAADDLHRRIGIEVLNQGCEFLAFEFIVLAAAN